MIQIKMRFINFVTFYFEVTEKVDMASLYLYAISYSCTDSFVM